MPRRVNSNKPPAVVTQTPPLTVFYDGGCPLCRSEIALYRGLKSLTPICYIDVNAAANEAPTGFNRRELLSRFHVRDASGSMRQGARAFVSLWAALPGWRWLAWMARLPGAVWMMDRLYDGFLLVRPLIQRMVRHGRRPGASD